jgi:oligopeptide transport system ATP-binding protein
MLLQVSNLRTYFQTKSSLVKAVDDISFDLAQRQTLSIVGESGSGKTAAALSLMRLIPGSAQLSGKIMFEDQDIVTMDRKALFGLRGDKIAMVFQDPMSALNPVLTIGEQLIEPYLIHRKMSRKQAFNLGIELLQKVRMKDAEKRMHCYPHELSGGMRQRVMIAMAIALHPPLIIADEPTTALDVSIAAELLELLKSITREQGSALLLITHNLGIVAQYADKVMIMYAGKIVEKASKVNLYQKPQHPYTQGLLASVPKISADTSKKLTPIPGNPPDLATPPKGCAFYDRCPLKITQCGRNVPKLTKRNDDHEVACFAKEAGR